MVPSYCTARYHLSPYTYFILTRPFAPRRSLAAEQRVQDQGRGRPSGEGPGQRNCHEPPERGREAPRPAEKADRRGRTGARGHHRHREGEAAGHHRQQGQAAARAHHQQRQAKDHHGAVQEGEAGRGGDLHQAEERAEQRAQRLKEQVRGDEPEDQRDRGSAGDGEQPAPHPQRAEHLRPERDRGQGAPHAGPEGRRREGEGNASV